MGKKKQSKTPKPSEPSYSQASHADVAGQSPGEVASGDSTPFTHSDQGWASLTLLSALLVSAYFSCVLRSVEFDDAYISYRFAVNLAAGHGLSFNPGERIEGYTNFLWVIMLAGGHRVGLPPHELAPLLGVASYLGIILLVWCVIRTRGQSERDSWVTLGLSHALLGALVIPKGFAAPAGSGLESHFFSLLAVLLGLTQHVAYPTRTSMRLVANLVPIAVVLTRPDGVVIVAASWAVTAFREAGRGPIAATMALLARVWPGLLGMAGYSAWKLAYFGSLVPNTYFARGADVTQLEAGVNYLRAFLGSYPQVLLMAPLVAIGCLYAQSPALRALSAFSAASSVLYAAYLVKVGGDFMEYRLILHVYPLLVCGASCGLSLLVAHTWKLASLTVAVILAASLMPAGLEPVNYMQSLEEMDSYVKVGKVVGLSLHELPQRTKVATTLIGTIGYYSGLTIIDQWGLIDPNVRTRAARERFFRGHVKFAGPDAAAAFGANLYIEHPHTCSCTNPDVEDLPNVFIRLGDDECLRAWYMKYDRELTWIFCTNPGKFSLYNVGFECK